MTAVLVACLLWLGELYADPTWAKIRSFLLGYFLGTFVMEWIWQRSSRGVWVGGNDSALSSRPAAAPSSE
jgi:hypothetical protein